MKIDPTISSGPLAKANQSAALKDAAKAFEAVFVRQMIGSMRQAGLGEDILGSRATDQFRELSDAKLADNMAETGSLGIAEMLLKQFGGTEGAR
jgi:flagellar protein FlgJ